MRTRVVLDRERRPCRRRERWLRRGRAREVPERSLATDSRRDRTSSPAYEAGVSDLERFERERVLGNSFVDLLRILPIVQQRGLEAGRPDVRQSLVELLLVGLHNLVSLNDFPHAEPCPSDFGLAPRDLVGEVDPGALAHPQGLLEQVLRDLGKGAAGGGGGAPALPPPGGGGGA